MNARRLIQLGDWLAVNGGRLRALRHTWCTVRRLGVVIVKDGSLYTLLAARHISDTKTAGVASFDQAQVSWGSIKNLQDDQGVSIAVPQLSVDEIPCRHVCNQDRDGFQNCSEVY